MPPRPRPPPQRPPRPVPLLPRFPRPVPLPRPWPGPWLRAAACSGSVVFCKGEPVCRQLPIPRPIGPDPVGPFPSIPGIFNLLVGLIMGSVFLHEIHVCRHVPSLLRCLVGDRKGRGYSGGGRSVRLLPKRSDALAPADFSPAADIFIAAWHPELSVEWSALQVMLQDLLHISGDKRD